MRKGLIILSIIGAILVAVSLVLDFKAQSIQDNLIKEYEERTEEKNVNEIAEDNESITDKSQEQNFNTYKTLKRYKNKGNKNNNSATNNPRTIAILKISSINLKAPIVDGEENLNYVVAKYKNSPNFGENGNTILAAHNNMKGSIFRNLYKVKIGDTVEVQNDNEVFKYKITQREIVEPNEPSLLTQDLSKKEITLITCTERSKKRLIIKGELI
ncbi:class D sortase [Clostridium perfringens]|nr:class D sortase [Clostridium perfringens]